jgi:hypothetical protein
MRRVCLGCLILLAATSAHAGTVIGKLDLPPPPARPDVPARGFLDRSENPILPVRPYTPTTYMVVVLEGDEKPVSSNPVTWQLVGESFDRPVLAAPAGAEIVIKNSSHVPRLVSALEDEKLIVGGLINPTGAKSFHTPDPGPDGKAYTIVAGKDAPHLRATLLIVNTQYIAYPDESGRFEVADIRPGSYKVKVWYRNGWLTEAATTVDVPAKGRAEVSPKIPATAFQPAKK